MRFADGAEQDRDDVAVLFLLAGGRSFARTPVLR